MRTKSRILLERLRRAVWADDATRPVVMIFGSPQVGKLQWLGRIPADVMISERVAVIGEEYFEAEPGESVKHFHARICDIARERGARIVDIGSAPSQEPQPYPPRRPDEATLN